MYAQCTHLGTVVCCICIQYENRKDYSISVISHKNRVTKQREHHNASTEREKNKKTRAEHNVRQREIKMICTVTVCASVCKVKQSKAKTNSKTRGKNE